MLIVYGVAAGVGKGTAIVGTIPGVIGGTDITTGVGVAIDAVGNGTLTVGSIALGTSGVGTAAGVDCNSAGGAPPA